MYTKNAEKIFGAGAVVLFTLTSACATLPKPSESQEQKRVYASARAKQNGGGVLVGLGVVGALTSIIAGVVVANAGGPYADTSGIGAAVAMGGAAGSLALWGTIGGLLISSGNELQYGYDEESSAQAAPSRRNAPNRQNRLRGAKCYFDEREVSCNKLRLIEGILESDEPAKGAAELPRPTKGRPVFLPGTVTTTTAVQ